MIGYSEVIQTMAAMIIFSVILMNANRMIHRNTVMQVEGELEQEVIALGQEIIEEAHTKAFDEVTYNPTPSKEKPPPANIPGDFTDPSCLGPDPCGNTKQRVDFNDFDDYNGWHEIARTPHGNFSIDVAVFYVDENTLEPTSPPTKSTFKKIEVTITSEFLRDGSGENRKYTLEFIRNFYAD